MQSFGAFETLTRAGFAARGLLYLLIGWLALGTGRAEDGADVLDIIAGAAGGLVVAAMAVGFFGYGAWRLLEAWVDSEGRGTAAKGLAVRIGGAASGLIHLGFGVVATRVAIGGRAGGGDSAEDGAAATLSLPGGELLMTLAAATVLAAGLYQLAKAWKLDFLRRLDSRAATRPWIAWLGRAGFVARGFVFLVIAWLAWRAANGDGAGAAGGLGDALDALPAGLKLAAAAGLLLFGLFSLVEARFRRIQEPAIAARFSEFSR